MPRPVTLSPKSVLIGALAAILAFVLVHVLVVTCWTFGQCGPATAFAMNFGGLFDLNQEMNLPTCYSVLQLGAVALALRLTACMERENGRRALPWNGLVALFLYMAADEMTDVHGLWGSVYLGQPIAAPVVDGFAWIVPALIVVGVTTAIYLPWVWQLPRRTRALFVLAGSVFVTGGVGMEAVGERVADASFFNPAYLVASTAEETLEMLGVAIMLYAVLAYMAGRNGRLEISARSVDPE